MEPRARVCRLCVCSGTLDLEFLEVGAAFLPGGAHDVEEVWRENEGDPFLTDSHETLVIAQDVAEVDVEEVSCTNTKEAWILLFVRSGS